MADITLSVGVRQSLAAIKSTTASQQQQQLKLATGKRVNSALDNPVNFFTSSSLSNRARDLSSLLDSIGQGVKVIEAADKGIKALTKLVESAQASARQALHLVDTEGDGYEHHGAHRQHGSFDRWRWRLRGG